MENITYKGFNKAFAACWDQIIGWEKRWDRDSSLIFSRLQDIHKGKKFRLLDLAAGTGVDLAYALLNDFEACGTDGSPEMLDIASRNLERLGLDISSILPACSWACIDQAEIGTFDAVICLGNSFACLTEVEERKLAMKNFAELLNSGGVLVIDRRNYEKIIEEGGPLKSQCLYYGDEVEIRRKSAEDFTFQYSINGEMFELSMSQVFGDELDHYALDSGLQPIDVLKLGEGGLAHFYEKR